MIKANVKKSKTEWYLSEDGIGYIVNSFVHLCQHQSNNHNWHHNSNSDHPATTTQFFLCFYGFSQMDDDSFCGVGALVTREHISLLAVTSPLCIMRHPPLRDRLIHRSRSLFISSSFSFSSRTESSLF